MTKTIKRLIITGVAAFLALILLSASFYTVNEDETAIINRLGRVDRVIVNPMDSEIVKQGLQAKGIAAGIGTTKGLNFKIPFIETVQKFSSKYRTYQSESATINTFDSRRIDLSIYAQYKVVNPALFNMTIGYINNAGSIMDDRVYPEVIQTANTLAFNEFFNKDKVSAALDQRKSELNQVLTAQFGLYIVDIGIFRKNFPQANISSIEQKMTQEIQKESEKLMAEGDSMLKQSNAETDRLKKETLAKAVEEAAVIKAGADSEAMQINEEALKVDIEFYKFINRMDSYKNLKDTTVFMDKSNDFINYLNNNRQ